MGGDETISDEDAGVRRRAAEQELEDLDGRRRRMLDSLDSYRDAMDRCFARLRESNQTLVEQGSRIARIDMDSDQEMQRYVRRLVEQQKDEVSAEFSRRRRQIEEREEALESRTEVRHS